MQKLDYVRVLKINMKEACRLCGRLRVLDSTVPEVIKNFDFTWVLPMVLPEREGLFCGSVFVCVCGGGCINS